MRITSNEVAVAMIFAGLALLAVSALDWLRYTSFVLTAVGLE